MFLEGAKGAFLHVPYLLVIEGEENEKRKRKGSDNER